MSVFKFIIYSLAFTLFSIYYFQNIIKISGLCIHDIKNESSINKLCLEFSNDLLNNSIMKSIQKLVINNKDLIGNNILNYFDRIMSSELSHDEQFDLLKLKICHLVFYSIILYMSLIMFPNLLAKIIVYLVKIISVILYVYLIVEFGVNLFFKINILEYLSYIDYFTLLKHLV